MKSFKTYLTESVRSYHYHIKILGTPDKKWLDLFCYNLDTKFDAIDISEPKSTPIQKSPFGFTGAANDAVTIIKAEFRYPAIEPMIRQVAKLLNFDENRVRVVQAGFDDSINTEAEQYENQMSHTPVLTHTELEDNGKEASKEYANQYLDRIREQHKVEAHEMSYAGEKTKDAFDPFKAIPRKPIDNSSPLSYIKMPPKPKSGSSR